MMRETVFAGMLLAAPPVFSQTITGADQGYQLAYVAFCAGNDAQRQNIYQLNKLGQISDAAFIEARFASLKDCFKPSMGGVPDGTFQAVAKLRDVKRVFHVPGGIAIRTATGALPQIHSAQIPGQSFTLLAWHIMVSSNVATMRNIIAAGADVNWRNNLAYPIIFYAAHRRNAEAFKLLADAGARLDILVPRTPWDEKVSEIVYGDFVTTQAFSIPYGSLQLHVARLKPEAENGGLWKGYQERGLTMPFIAYVAGTCTEFRSPACWQMLNVMLDKGVKSPQDLLHAFFRNNQFTIHPAFPEAAAGLDRLIRAGASLNATNSQGKTILARLMDMRVPPETLQAIIARGGKLLPTSGPAGQAPAPGPKPPGK